MGAPMQYTVKVKRAILPGYRTYTVRAHSNEDLGGTTRLVLTAPDGSITCIPNIQKKLVKFGADFYQERQRTDNEKNQELWEAQTIAQREAEIAAKAVSEYRLSEQLRNQQAFHQQGSPGIGAAAPGQLAQIRQQQGR